MNKKVPIPDGLHIIAKPIGSKCNLDCDYCFYLEKEKLLGNQQNIMSDEVLETYIKNYITSQSTPVVEFVWHGGEPTLLGLSFYKKVVDIQKKYAQLKTINNSLQTNGTLINKEWCEFLKENNFIVGLSLDGPKDIHDKYRKDKVGKNSFDKVFNALKLFQEYKVEYNVLCCITREYSTKPLEIYKFFKDYGVKFIQFTPLVEKIPTMVEKNRGQTFGSPSALESSSNMWQVTPWSVEPKTYGDFLVSIFDTWVREDVGEIFISNFEGPIAQWFGNPSPNCIHARQCGKSLAMENNGDVYACDHFVYPEYKLGNIKSSSLMQMAKSSIATGFGREKEEKLTNKCLGCPSLQLCFGGCPKHRFVKLAGEKYEHNYLCKGYETFFGHIPRYLKAISELLTNGYPASYVMEMIKGPLVLPKKK